MGFPRGMLLTEPYDQRGSRCAFNRSLLLVAVLLGPRPGHGLGLSDVAAPTVEPTAREVLNISRRGGLKVAEQTPGGSLTVL